MKNYIKRKQSQSNHFKTFGIEVLIKDQLNNNISVRSVVKKLALMVPKKLLLNIDKIYVGQFEELKDRNLQALYRDSKIFVTNEQESEADLLDDLVHEVAHSVEEVYQDQIYGDGSLEREFLIKREKLWTLLSNKGFKLDLKKYLNPKYTREFDLYLYRDVGYPLLSSMAVNVFYSPYAATSLREYFATGFEAFFLREEIPRLKTISPILYNILSELI